jgi:hypothetical protein
MVNWELGLADLLPVMYCDPSLLRTSIVQDLYFEFKSWMTCHSIIINSFYIASILHILHEVGGLLWPGVVM